MDNVRIEIGVPGAHQLCVVDILQYFRMHEVQMNEVGIWNMSESVKLFDRI